MSNKESFSKSDKFLTGLALGGILATGGAFAYKQGQADVLNDRKACIDIPVRDGDGPAIMLKRFKKADLNPTGQTIVFKADGDVLISDKGFPSKNGSSEFTRNDIVAVENANPDACIDPLVGGTVSDTLIDTN